MITPSVLVAALLRLSRRCYAPRLSGLGFFPGDVALRTSLPLLCATFVTEFVISDDRAGRFLELALGAFDNTLRARFRSSVLFRHCTAPL